MTSFIISRFDTIKPTAVVFMDYFNAKLKLDLLFTLFPIKRIVLTHHVIKRTKIVLPILNDCPGAILSCKFRDETRGIIVNKKSTFKNCITIIMCIPNRLLNIAIYKNKLLIRGCHNEDEARLGIQYIFEHILDIQEKLNLVHQNINETGTILDKLYSIIKGNEILRDKTEMEGETNASKIKDYDIKHIANVNEFFGDANIANFFNIQALGYNHLSHFKKECNWICNTSKEVYNGDLDEHQIITTMVNINYSLGFKVNLNTLSSMLNNAAGFFCIYDNSVQKFLNIKLPYTRTSEENDLIKSKKPACHSFIVKRSGNVTQSGPGGERMKEAYLLFMKRISSIRELIIDDTENTLSTSNSE